MLLTPSILQHLQVLRAKVDRTIVLFNGDGFDYHCTLTELQRRHASVVVDNRQQANTESPIHTHLALVMSKGDRFDTAIQKATELGVIQITPLMSERCDVKLDAGRIEKRLNHWNQIIKSACEQSGRAVLPTLNGVVSFEEFVESNNQKLSLLLSPYSSENIASIYSNNLQEETINLVIGPEGGLTELEVEHALQKGYEAIRIGPRILRTETAPIAVLSMIQMLWGDV